MTNRPWWVVCDAALSCIHYMSHRARMHECRCEPRGMNITLRWKERKQSTRVESSPSFFLSWNWKVSRTGGNQVSTHRIYWKFIVWFKEATVGWPQPTVGSLVWLIFWLCFIIRTLSHLGQLLSKIWFLTWSYHVCLFLRWLIDLTPWQSYSSSPAIAYHTLRCQLNE